MNSISLRAPATVANLVCGFDILGMALCEPYDDVEVIRTDTPGVRITHTDGYGLPEDPMKNVAGVSLLEMLAELREPVGLHVRIHKGIKPGSGLGSSAASSAGPVAAANRLLGKPFAPADLVRFAMAGEKLATGVKHADNIAPCLYGDITLIRAIAPLDIVSITPPPLLVTVVHPQIEVRTADARQVLRQTLLLKDAIRQWGNIAGLVTGLLTADYPLIGRSLEDVVIEPARSILIPGFDEVKRASMAAGALGGGISGSGPALFMLSRTEDTAAAIALAMQNIYLRLGIEANTYITKVNTEGCY